MDVEEVVQRLIAQNRAQAKEIEDLRIQNNTLQVALDHFQKQVETCRSIDEIDLPKQYTWDEAEKQFRVDL